MATKMTPELKTKKLTAAQQNVLAEMASKNYTVEVWGGDSVYFSNVRGEAIGAPRTATVNALIEAGALVEQSRRTQKLVRGQQTEVVTYIITPVTAAPVAAEPVTPDATPAVIDAAADESAIESAETSPSLTAAAARPFQVGDRVRTSRKVVMYGAGIVGTIEEIRGSYLPIFVRWESRGGTWFDADELELVASVDDGAHAPAATALETALARNRELEAQNAALKAAGRAMLKHVDWRGIMLDIAQDERDYVALAGATMAAWHALFADDGDGA